MFTFLANVIAAQRNAAALATVKADLFALEGKAKNIIAHATGGQFADIDASLNTICVKISALRSRIYTDARAAERAELAGDLLHSMHEAERKVLVTFHEEVGWPLADVAEHTGIALNDVRTLAKGLVVKGLAFFGPLADDEGRPAGSGYLLTPEGGELKSRALAADVVASAAAVSA